MDKFLLLSLSTLHMVTFMSSAEHIEISTGAPIALPTPTMNSKNSDSLQGSNFFKAVENYLTESTNVKRQEKSKQSGDYITEPMYPVYPIYNPVGKFNPDLASKNDHNQTANYFSVMVPALKNALRAGLQIFVQLFSYLLEGAGILAIGGIITTVICYLTSICTVKYNGFGSQKQDLSKDTMRASMTPDKFASAAALVQEAIGKYQKLQKTTV